jgi:hypothetical protein
MLQQTDGSLGDVVTWTLHDDRFSESPWGDAQLAAYGPAGTLLVEHLN